MGSLYSGLRESSLDELLVDAKSDPSDDSPAMNEIVRRFEPLAISLARGVTSCSHTQEDAANAARLGAVRAVRAHDLGRPGFPAYARQFMHGETVRAVKRTASCDIPVEDMSVVDGLRPISSVTIDGTESSSWGHGPVASIVMGLPKDRRELLSRRYVEDWPLAWIAGTGGTSVSAVSQRLSTLYRVIRGALAA